MLLAIDIGNTNVVIGCMEDGNILVEARIATETQKTSDQYCMDLKNILSLYAVQLTSIDNVVISSVVPQVLNSMRTAIMKLIGKTPLVVGPGIRTGLNIKMDNPAQVGSDLIVSSVAALQKYKPPLIIVDMGTATTLMALDETGAFLGGSICPGVKISADALAGRTAQLPAISLDSTNSAIGKNTVDAMRSGLMLGSACMVDGLVEHMKEELGGEATVLVTGGIAKYVLPMCRQKMIYERNLILDGLYRIYQLNQKNG